MGDEPVNELSIKLLFPQMGNFISKLQLYNE